MKTMFRLGVLIVSDAGFRGERDDVSGHTAEAFLSQRGFALVRREVVPDERETIAQLLAQWADSGEVDLLVTTGGTGLGPRDVTPDATLSVVQRQVPGIAEAMRMETLKKTPMAMLSRSVVGLRGRCLIINLPGSPKGVLECLEVVYPVLPHALEVLQGVATGHPTSS